MKEENVIKDLENLRYELGYIKEQLTRLQDQAQEVMDRLVASGNYDYFGSDEERGDEDPDFYMDAEQRTAEETVESFVKDGMPF